MGSIRIFRHYISVSFLALGAVEFMIFMISVYAGAHIRFFGDDVAVRSSVGELLPRAMVYAPVMAMSMVAMGLYQARLRESFTGIVLRISASFIVGMVVLAVIFYIVPPLFLGRGALILTLVVSFAFVCISRGIFYPLLGKDDLKRRILVLGSGDRASALTKLRRRVDQRGFRIVGYVHVKGEHAVVDPDMIVHLKSRLIDYVVEHEIDEVVVAVSDRRQKFPLYELLDCRMSGIDVIDIATFFEREIGKIRLDIVHPSWLIFSDGFQQNAVRENTKRLFDLSAGLIMLLLTWPIMLFTAMVIFIESGMAGPILYRQVRIGYGGKPFVVLKLRSMRTDAEKDGEARWAEKNDSRVTRVGSLIRRYRIDELPQIFNVLRGDMSFVGPRPEQPEFVAELSEHIPYYPERHRVKPGITGWAQLCYPYGASEEDALEKLQYDLYYLKNHSLFLDLTILIQTAEVIFWGKGAR